MDDSPLFARAYDLLRESCLQSERMPRSRRAVLGRRMEEAALDFHAAITSATKARDPRPLLAQEDAALSRWRICFDLAVPRGTLPGRCALGWRRHRPPR